MNDSHAGTTQKIGIGVDFGTSNSVAALFDGRNITLVKLEQNSPIMPSATYIDRQLKITTGQAAIDAYISGNTGRKVELSAEVLGEGRTSTGQTGDYGLPEEAATQKFYGQSIVDAGEPGRLFRGVKRLLGDSTVSRLMVFDRPFRLVALITPLLLYIRQAIEEALAQPGVPPGQQANHACIGHPVNFEGRATDSNSSGMRRLAEACRYAGVERRSFYPEPIAAATSYLLTRSDLSVKRLLAVDFGGGTLDLCIMEQNNGQFQVVATHGIGLGGDHIDQQLFRALLFPLLGKGERWRRKGEDREIETLFPFEQYEDLILNWAVSYRLNQNQYTTPVMDRMEAGDEAAIKFRRLYELIKQNYSYLAFQCIKEVKASLSEQQTAWLDIPEIDVELEVTRSQFEELISGLLEEFRLAVTTTLDMANIESQQVDLVIRTGGSCLIPAVKNILNQQFPDKVVEHDPFTGVASGLAIAEYHGLGSAFSD